MFAALLVPAARTFAQSVTWPARRRPDVATFPRVTGIADTAAQRRVNTLLTRRDATTRTDRAECASSARDGARARGDRFRGIDFTQSVRVAHLSPRYLSLEVHRGWYCGGPYPTNDSPEPITIDLRTGREVDVAQHFLRASALAAGTGEDDESPLGRLYEARYSRLTPPDSDCLDQATLSGSAPAVWIETRGAVRGLAVMPRLPHVVEACAEPIVLTRRELGALATSALATELGP